MLQTKIFLSDENADPSSFCMAEDYFNAWMAENPNVIIKDVKYQHVMTEENYLKQSSSIFVLFEVPEGSKSYSLFTWHSVWDQRFLFAQEMQDKDWCLNKCKEEPTFPLVGKLPETYTPVLVKIADGWYKVSMIKEDADGIFYFEGVDAEYFEWQYLPK